MGGLHKKEVGREPWWEREHNKSKGALEDSEVASCILCPPSSCKHIRAHNPSSIGLCSFSLQTFSLSCTPRWISQTNAVHSHTSTSALSLSHKYTHMHTVNFLKWPPTHRLSASHSFLEWVPPPTPDQPLPSPPPPPPLQVPLAGYHNNHNPWHLTN